MGYGIIELKCPKGHVWNTEWCSVSGSWKSPLVDCPTCGQRGQDTKRNVLAEAAAEADDCQHWLAAGFAAGYRGWQRLAEKEERITSLKKSLAHAEKYGAHPLYKRDLLDKLKALTDNP